MDFTGGERFSMKKMNNLSTILVLTLTWLFLLTLSSHAKQEAVASIKKIQGTVDIERDNKILPARTGLILYDQDMVVTSKKSKVSIIFRDGTVIRLFPNTRFLIEKSVETEKGSRRFLHNFILKVGSFWGKFTQKRQETVIKTPTATAGIKGTNAIFAVREDGLSVGLSMGKISINNDNETIELQPGRIVKGITKKGTIKDKITDMPYRLVINPDHRKIVLPQPGNENELFFTLQLIDIKTNKNVSQSGAVHVSPETDRITFSSSINLNSRGYARIKATIKPFQEKDYDDGEIEILAIMDGEEFIDVGAARTFLTYDLPQKKSRTIKIDAKTGKIQ